METEEFNYGRLFNFFLNGNWIKGDSKKYVPGFGQAYCLSTALWELYGKSEKTYEIRLRMIEKIKELYPTRTSKFATKLAQAKEPLITDQYSLVAFNDHPETDIDDILLLCKECRV